MADRRPEASPWPAIGGRLCAGIPTLTDSTADVTHMSGRVRTAPSVARQTRSALSYGCIVAEELSLAEDTSDVYKSSDDHSEPSHQYRHGIDTVLTEL